MLIKYAPGCSAGCVSMPLAANDEGVMLSKMRIAVGAVSLDTFKQGFRETASANGTAERREFGANGP